MAIMAPASSQPYEVLSKLQATWETAYDKGIVNKWFHLSELNREPLKLF